MTAWLVARAVAARVAVLALAAGLVVLGGFQARDAQTDVLPEFSPPYVEVQTEALGLSAEEVEQLITAPMENLLLNGVAFLDGIRSESVNGLSSITLIFEPGTDLLQARQVVQERLTQSGLLAHLIEPPVMVQPMSSASRVLVVGFASEDVSAIDMSVLARWTIRPRLLGVPGVANVSIFGQRERQLQVQVDPRRLARHDVTLDEIVHTTGNALWVSPLSYLAASSPGTGGFVDTPSTRLEIRHVSPIVSPADLQKVALERAPGSEARSGLTLGDVARVTEDHQPLIGDAVVDDGPGLVMVIEKLPSANTVEVTEGVEDALETLAPGLRGISVDTNVFHPASFVEQSRDNYLVTLGAGLLLAFLVVLLITLSMRTILVALVTTVVSAAGSLVVLDLLGVDLNVMVLAGLGLAAAVVVQDSVGDAAVVVRRWREPSVEAALPRITAAILEMRRSLGFATAVGLAAMLPLLALDRLSEAFVRPALLAFVVTVLVSSLVALTVSPAMWSVLLRGAPERDSSPAERLHQGIAGMVRRSARATVPVVVGVLALGVAVGAAVLPFLHTDDRAAMLPEFQESDVVVSWRGEPGISRPAMTAIAAELGAELRAVPGVESVGGHVGRAILSDQINGIGEGELWVGLEPGADHEESVDGLRAVAEDYAGAEAEVRSFVADRVEAVGGLLSEYDRGRLVSGDDEVVVRIYGEELPVLVEQAEAIERRVGELGGVDDVRVELPPVEPNLEVEVDLDQAERYGLKPGDIRRTATTLANGLRVGSLFEEQKVFDVIVNGAREYFADPARVGELLIGTPSGGTVPLERVADVRSGESFSAINRESVSRRLDLVATVSGDRGEAVDAIEDALADVAFPLEYHAEVIGPEAGEKTDWRWVLAVGAVGLIAALLLLQMAVRSWRMTVVVLATVLFSLAGGVVATALAGREVTIGSILGFLGVLVVAVRGSLCLVGHDIALRGVEPRQHDAEIVGRGAADQAQPVLLSGAVAVAVMLPALVAGVRPGLEIVYPMAVVVIGGAVAATAANLLLLLAMYLRWGGRLEPDVLEQAADVRPPVGV